MIETQDGYCGGLIREWHYMKYKSIDHCIFKWGIIYEKREIGRLEGVIKDFIYP